MSENDKMEIENDNVNESENGNENVKKENTENENENQIEPENDIENELDEVDEGVNVPIDPDKITILPGASEDLTAASFQIKDEDHTLGNSLRYIIMKNPEVEFCGYSIPHPSEAKLNFRIQTFGKITAIDALEKGLDDLADLCDHVETVYVEKVQKGGYSTDDVE